jgi:hypothetical protein
VEAYCLSNTNRHLIRNNFMVAPVLIGAGLQIAGGLLGGRSARKAAAARAETLRQEGNRAFESSRFRPVGITSRFGSSNFQVDPNTGALIGADYEASPEVAAIQDRLFTQMGEQGLDTAEQSLAAQQGLFDLGRQYLAESPEAAAQSWMQRQQDALAPARERAFNQVQQSAFNRGSSSLAVAQGAGMQAANPQMAAYFNALAQQDLNLAKEAQEQGRAATRFGAGLFGVGTDIAAGGYRPFATQFELTRGLETAAQQPLLLGSDLGARASNINANAANMRLGALTDAAGSQARADSWNPWATALTAAGSAMGDMNFGGWFGGGAPQADMSVVGYNGPGRGNWF